MEIQIQDVAWYAKLAERNHRGLVPMRFLVNAMPYRLGDIAGFLPDQARRMHGAGDAVPYIADGETAPAAVSTGFNPSSTAEQMAENARLDAIEDLSPAILAEDKLAQIAMAKRIKGVDTKAKISGEEAVQIITAELDRRERAASAGTPPPGVLSTQTAGSTLPQART